MVRGKVVLKRIENKVNQQVTFSKRRTGLLKKAHEISVLCDADVGLMIFSTKGKLSEYATDSCMERILDRYERSSSVDGPKAPDLQSPGSWNVELGKLKTRLEVLQKNHSNLSGDNLESLSMKEVQNLEHQLDVSLKKLRSRKNHLMNESISMLQKKDKAMQEQNNLLSRKMKEKTIESTPPCEAQNHNTNALSLDLEQPLSSLNTGEENEGHVGQSEPCSNNGDMAALPWMLHHIQMQGQNRQT
ncbi:agamous-like MADS-box protein AGL8 homolog [Salvia splendens]|uniref:agamous-like MADS-box protein AGL8 homolog n=1 Tax=Salvia splendens TaxID=180675 RepID=UPI0011009581|nr:agamous-like MADS-box protein AGL8 homolog [Salvia splendens]